MKWSEVDTASLVLTDKRNGGSKITPLLRFQIPTARVMYDGVSNFKSVTLEMPSDFVEWWTASLDTLLPEPYRSNMKDNGLRVKVEPGTQFFNDSRKSIFPSIDEGGLKGETLTCIIDIPGTYFFQDMNGFIVRMYQAVVQKRHEEPVIEEGTRLTGCAFLTTETENA